MKRIAAILSTFVIILAGMHVSVASHYCGGEFAASKVSFSEKAASCGMENSNPISSKETEVSALCCENFISTLKVDNSFNASKTLVKEPACNSFHYTVVCETISLFQAHQNIIYIADNVIHDIGIANAVPLPDICVFRI
jgi:hypothetical protein